jgi:hypothetical protein
MGEDLRGPRGRRTSEYYTWTGMRQRCFNPKSCGYHHYGGRGITVCARWLSFDNFIADMGPKPFKNYSLERIDVNGNYEPDNCIWADVKTQNGNRRNTQKVVYDGRLMSRGEAREISGWSKDTIQYRMGVMGMSLEEALATEKTRKGPEPTRRVSFEGQEYTLGELSKLTGRSKSALWYQLFDRGRTVEELFNKGWANKESTHVR